MRTKRIERIDKEIKEEFAKLIPIDNDAFVMFALSKSFCQEFLRVILQDEALEVIDNHPQQFLPNMYFKDVRLDMLCKLSDGRIVNVEIQLYKEKSSARRIFYYASRIEQASVKKGTKYEDIKDIIVIYLTKKDLFNMGSTVYNVDMQIKSDLGQDVEKWDCGLKVLYVNTVGLTNKTINEYLQILTDRVTYNEKYVATSSIKHDIIELEGKGMKKKKSLMEKIIELEVLKAEDRGEIRGREIGEARGIVSMFKKGFVSLKNAAAELNMSPEEFTKLASTM